jgi:type II secretory pathway predicted ATPase ExeA
MTTALPKPLADFGLTRFPFPKAPAADDLFHWPALDETVARLQFGLAAAGFALLTGEVGAGKSTALRLFLHQLDPNVYPSVYIADSTLTPRTLYGRVLTHFGVPAPTTAGRARQQFQALFSDLAIAQGKLPVVIIDEGHELSEDMVRELRYLQNVRDCDAQSPFALVLCGQPELRAQLRFKTFDAVAQRISVRAHLAPLDLTQTTAFVTHALRTAGLDRPLFTEAALSLLHAHSTGLCRRIGNLATHALLDTAFTRSDLVEEASVRRAVAELEN